MKLKFASFMDTNDFEDIEINDRDDTPTRLGYAEDVSPVQDKDEASSPSGSSGRVNIYYKKKEAEIETPRWDHSKDNSKMTQQEHIETQLEKINKRYQKPIVGPSIQDFEELDYFAEEVHRINNVNVYKDIKKDAVDDDDDGDGADFKMTWNGITKKVFERTQGTSTMITPKSTKRKRIKTDERFVSIKEQDHEESD